MTDTITVEIPADVHDNDVHVVRVTSRDTRDTEGGYPAHHQLDDYRRRPAFFGYTMHEFDTFDRDHHRVTLTWFADTQGQAVWLYMTEYFTRVACARCPYRWAVTYAVTEQDSSRTSPLPLCSEDLAALDRHVRGARDAGVDLTLHRSDWLRIGRH